MGIAWLVVYAPPSAHVPSTQALWPQSILPKAIRAFHQLKPPNHMCRVRCPWKWRGQVFPPPSCLFPKPCHFPPARIVWTQPFDALHTAAAWAGPSPCFCVLRKLSRATHLEARTFPAPCLLQITNNVWKKIAHGCKSNPREAPASYVIHPPLSCDYREEGIFYLQCSLSKQLVHFFKS